MLAIGNAAQTSPAIAFVRKPEAFCSYWGSKVMLLSIDNLRSKLNHPNFVYSITGRAPVTCIITPICAHIRMHECGINGADFENALIKMLEKSP